MRSIKALGLAALAAVAAMALISTNSAAAQDEVVLCKALEELCAKGNLWPSGTEFLALAANPTLLGVLPFKCEELVIRGKTTAEVGSPLLGEITYVQAGVLPTPELGAGCLGCPFGLKTQIHVAPFLPFSAQFKVSGKDEFKLLIQNVKDIVLCGSIEGMRIECGFEIKDLESEAIKHNGEHKEHPGASNLALIPIQTTVSVFKDTSGLGICGETAILDTQYVVYLAHQGLNTGLAWPSLGKKA